MPPSNDLSRMVAPLALTLILAGCPRDKDDTGPSECDPGQLWCGECCDAVGLAAGADFTCALTDHASVKCWGENDWGQLGDGTQQDRVVPGPVTGLDGGVTSIVAGEFHACALTDVGGVKCWGWNEEGQIGNGSRADQVLPADVTGLTSGVVAISADRERTCAQRDSGEVLCWGAVRGTGNELEPAPVPGLSTGYGAPVVGEYDELLCAIQADGTLGCLEDTISGSAQGVTGLRDPVQSVSIGGEQACVLTTDGAVRCWGDNFDGQLGDGSWTDQDRPVSVSGLDSGVQMLDADGHAHGCAVTADGALWCWGANYYAQVGSGTTVDQGTPIQVMGIGGPVSLVDTGDMHTCVITTEGTTWCWGYNWSGQLGNGFDHEEIWLNIEPIQLGQ